jgi:hypothetical protein
MYLNVREGRERERGEEGKPLGFVSSALHLKRDEKCHVRGDSPVPPYYLFSQRVA